MAMTRMFRYVALGDSTSVGVGADAGGGYPERLWQRMRASALHAGLLNLGESGATSARLVERQLPRTPRPADLVTLGIGSNDLWRLTPLESFRADVERIATLLEATGADILVCNLIDLSHAPAAKWALPSMGISPEVITERVRALNAILDELAARPRFQVANLHDLGHGELESNPDYFSSDGFHPSAKGYARWADLLWPFVESTTRKWAASGARAG